MRWQWHQLDYMQLICTSLQTEPCQHLITQFPTDRILFLTTNQQCQSTEASHTYNYRYINIQLKIYSISSINIHHTACIPQKELWQCWLGVRKSIRTVKNWVMRFSHGCLEWGANLHVVQLMPLPPHHLFIKIQLGLTFLMTAYRGCPGKGDIKVVSVLV